MHDPSIYDPSMSGYVTDVNVLTLREEHVLKKPFGDSPTEKGRIELLASSMATVKREHSVGPEDVLDKEKATWWADTSVGVLEHSRKFSQSVLEAGEPKLLSMKDREMTLDSFYQFVDEYQPENANEDLLDWLDRDKDNGVVQVYTPGSSYCDLVKCTVSTTTETIMAKCLAKELYVQYGGRVRKLDAVDHPLHVQNEFLRSIGYEERKRIQLEGISPELGCLFKLVAGESTH